MTQLMNHSDALLAFPILLDRYLEYALLISSLELTVVE